MTEPATDHSVGAASAESPSDAATDALAVTTDGADTGEAIDAGDDTGDTGDAGPVVSPRPARRAERGGGVDRRFLVSGALVVLAVAALATAAALPGMRLARVGGDAPVDPAAAVDLRNLTASNSPVLVRSPVDEARLALANRIDAPGYSCALRTSADGGATWREVAIPFPDGEELPARCYAPDLAYGADGTLHLLFSTLEGPGNRPHATWHAVLTGDGAALSTPTRVLGPLAFQARLAADPTRPDRLIVAWLQAATTAYLAFPDTGNPIMVARSDDRGATWGEPVRVSPESRARVLAPTLRATAGGLLVAYLDVDDDRLDYSGAHQGRGGAAYQGRWSLVLARSADGGAWHEQVVDDRVVPVDRFVVFVPPTPALATDDAGHSVYLAVQDARRGDGDVWLWASADGGRTFRSHRVNDTPVRDGRHQYLPQLALADGGRLDVAYYDRRRDPRDVRNEVSFQSSWDGGRHFTRRLVLSGRSFDSRIGFGSERGLADLGSRLGLVAGRRAALVVWTDTRAGTRSSGRQDLAQAVVRAEQGPPWRGRLRVAAGLLGAVAAVAAAGGVPGLGRTRRRASGRRA